MHIDTLMWLKLNKNSTCPPLLQFRNCVIHTESPGTIHYKFFLADFEVGLGCPYNRGREKSLKNP